MDPDIALLLNGIVSGLLLGGISSTFEMIYPGIVFQAVLATLAEDRGWAGLRGLTLGPLRATITVR